MHLHPDRASLKKCYKIVSRAIAAVTAIVFLTVTSVSIVLESPSGRPVAETMVLALIVGIAATILEHAVGNVVDTYRASARRSSKADVGSVTALEAGRAAELDEGLVLELLVDQYALMSLPDACRFLRWARTGDLDRNDIDQVMRAIP